MTYLVKTGQEVVDYVQALIKQTEAKPNNGNKNREQFLMGEMNAYRNIYSFLSDLFIGEVKLTDLTEITYKKPAGDFYDRMLIEHRELKAKLHGLSNFITNQPLFRTLPHEEQALQIAQHGFMVGYKATLELRIEIARQRIAAMTLKPADKPFIHDSVVVDTPEKAVMPELREGERPKEGRPTLPQSEYDALREDDKFLYNRGDS